ncbi:MAG: tetratricopeptide repeat protein [Aquimonas sp.]|nr:tetratricopeptide repeat protein [Aquimonas sp.]
MQPDITSPPPPSSAQQALLRGQEHLALGQPEAARTCASQALGDHPDWPPARLLLVNACLQLGELDTAIRHLQGLCQTLGAPPPLQAALATALNNRGSRSRRAGDTQAALHDFDAALQASPGHALAGFNRALTLADLGRLQDAREALGQHLTAHPQDLEAAVQQALWDPQAGESLQTLVGTPGFEQLPAELRLRCALRLADTAALLALLDQCGESQAKLGWACGEALRAAEQPEAARRAYRHALQGPQPAVQAAFAEVLAGPRLFRSKAEVDAERQRLDTALSQLEAELPELLTRARPGLDSLCYGRFFLAYQGRNDRALQARLSALTRRAAAALAPGFDEPPACAHPRRVLLVGSLFRDCTAGAYFGGWIDWLREAGYEVVLYQLGPRRDAETERMAAAASRFEFVPEDLPLDTLAAQLRAEQAGLLLYPELGMDTRLTALSALRLARRQALAWGHPVTSGLDCMDAYFSCAEMEPADAADHYVEPLHLLPGLGVDYRRPPASPPASRAELGLPEGAPLVLVPHSLFKLLPDNDAVYAAALAADPRARLVLFEGFPMLRPTFEARLQRQGIDTTRLLWLPAMPRARFLQVNAACDLMLDSLHFSGGNASLDALQSGLPVLTWPGALMRGRQTAAMLARLGLGDALCAPTLDSLPALAAELLRSGALPDLRQHIAPALPELFDPEPARRAFIEHVETLVS